MPTLHKELISKFKFELENNFFKGKNICCICIEPNFGTDNNTIFVSQIWLYKIGKTFLNENWQKSQLFCP